MWKIETALQQNETTDIFADLLAALGDDDQTEGPRVTNYGAMHKPPVQLKVVVDALQY